MLIAAAAEQWKVDPATCRVANGFVVAGEKKLSFGQLAAAVFQGACAATPEQHARILDIVNAARRDIYGVLGEAE